MNEICKINPDIKVLFVSGYPEDTYTRKGILQEGLSILSKPISPNELLKKIRDILNGYSD